MGSFNSSGFLSRLPILAGDRVVCFVALVNHNDEIMLSAPDALVSPFFLPVRGKYDDYGSVTDVDRTHVVEMIEKYGGDSVENLFHAVERCLYGRTVDDNIEYWERAGIQEDVNMYVSLKRFIATPDCGGAGNKADYSPVLLMEHESIYDKVTEDWPTDRYGWGSSEKRFSVFLECLREAKELRDGFTGTGLNARLANDIFNCFVPNPFSDLGWSQSTMSLAFSFLEGEDGDAFRERVKTCWDKLIAIRRLISGESSKNTLKFFNALDTADRVGFYEKNEDELRRFICLWSLYMFAPMYFSFSQTAGHQMYSLDVFEKVFRACDEYLAVAREREDEEMEEY